MTSSFLGLAACECALDGSGGRCLQLSLSPPSTPEREPLFNVSAPLCTAAELFSSPAPAGCSLNFTPVASASLWDSVSLARADFVQTFPTVGSFSDISQSA